MAAVKPPVVTTTGNGGGKSVMTMAAHVISLLQTGVSAQMMRLIPSFAYADADTVAKTCNSFRTWENNNRRLSGFLLIMIGVLILMLSLQKDGVIDRERTKTYYVGDDCEHVVEEDHVCTIRSVRSRTSALDGYIMVFTFSLIWLFFALCFVLWVISSYLNKYKIRGSNCCAAGSCEAGKPAGGRCDFTAFLNGEFVADMLAALTACALMTSSGLFVIGYPGYFLPSWMAWWVIWLPAYAVLFAWGIYFLVTGIEMVQVQQDADRKDS